MSSIWSEITRYAKKLKNVTCTQKKNRSVEMDSEVTEMKSLAHRDVKMVIITMLELLKKNMSIMRREMEDIKKNQMELLKMKNIVSKI